MSGGGPDPDGEGAPGAQPGGTLASAALVSANSPQLIHAATGLPFSDKGRKTAGLLQILLAGFAAGRFYLGYPKIAVLQILATWLTCGAGILWPIVDGLRILDGRVPDAAGKPLRED
jgi:TM2 domain-containing membrane protein YozV